MKSTVQKVFPIHADGPTAHVKRRRNFSSATPQSGLLSVRQNAFSPYQPRSRGTSIRLLHKSHTVNRAGGLEIIESTEPKPIVARAATVALSVRRVNSRTNCKLRRPGESSFPFSRHSQSCLTAESDRTNWWQCSQIFVRLQSGGLKPFVSSESVRKTLRVCFSRSRGCSSEVRAASVSRRCVSCLESLPVHRRGSSFSEPRWARKAP